MVDYDDNGRSKWLDFFFGNCSDVVSECDPTLIKVIAYHDFKGDAARLEGRINGIWERYNRPIWVTEHAVGRWEPSPLRPEQEAYMKTSLPLLESHPAVQRYVWHFSRGLPTRWGGVGNLLDWNTTDPTLTSTGEIYAAWPEGDNNTPLPTSPPTEPFILQMHNNETGSWCA